MMKQAWAVVAPDSDFRILYTSNADEHPVDAGCAEECKGASVFALPREPDRANGETVTLDGQIVFDRDTVRPRIVDALKKSAAKQIEEFYPWWKQQNDMEDHDAPGVAERRERKNAIRQWSNDMEEEFGSVSSVEELKEFLSRLPI